LRIARRAIDGSAYGARDARGALALPALLALVTIAAVPPKSVPPAPPDASHTIVMHVGIPGVAYLGQHLKELLERFPKAQMTQFAKQEDVWIVSVPEEGLSCYLVGPARDSLTVASVGFNFEETYLGAQEGKYRTREGIGKGSTVNDLLGTYGKPVAITAERGAKPSPQQSAPREDPGAPKKYQYANPNGTIKTYFVVQGYRVVRAVVNDLAPLAEHVLKNPPAKN